MYDTLALQRLRRTLLIQRIVQILLCVLLVYMALHFQQMFVSQGNAHVLRNSLLVTLLVQLALFFPLRHLAGNEARRELTAATVQATAEQQKQLRQQRLFGDILKGAIFLGFVIFILIAPPVTFILSTTFFCFIVTVVTYLQCFNFVVRKGIDNPTAAAH